MTATVTLTPREQAIKLLGQGKIRALVTAQTGLTDEALDALVSEVGGEEAIRRASAAIRRGDRSWAEPAAVEDQPAADAVVAPLTVAFEVIRDAVRESADMSQDDVALAPPEPTDADWAIAIDRHAAEHIARSSHAEAELAEAQAGLTAAEHHRAARMLRAADIADTAPPFLGTAATGRAVLTMPLARLVDADGTETVIAEAVVNVDIDRDGLLALLAGDDATPVRWTVGRRLTEDGTHAVRGLAQLLESGDGRG